MIECDVAIGSAGPAVWAAAREYTLHDLRVVIVELEPLSCWQPDGFAPRLICLVYRQVCRGIHYLCSDSLGIKHRFSMKKYSVLSLYCLSLFK